MSACTIDEVRAKFGAAFADLESRARLSQPHIADSIAGGKAKTRAQPAPPQLIMEIMEAAQGIPTSAPRTAEETIAQLDIIAELDARLAHANDRICAASHAIYALLMSLARSNTLRMARANPGKPRKDSRKGGDALTTLRKYAAKVARVRAQADALVACVPVPQGFVVTEMNLPPFILPSFSDEDIARTDPQAPEIARMLEVARIATSAERVLMALVEETKKVEFIADYVIAQCAALNAKCQS